MDKKPEEILEESLQRAKTLQQIEKLEKEKEIEFKNRKEKDKEFNQRLLDIQKKCIHIWKYFPDASGNNDSFYDCLVCGATNY